MATAAEVSECVCLPAPSVLVTPHGVSHPAHAPPQARWIHQRPEERLGRFIPNRGRDGHMQYVPRCAPSSRGSGTRLAPRGAHMAWLTADGSALLSVQAPRRRAQAVW